ncbi:hypothetical protein DSO57_1026671 [Entomophthora muscae]|uniref:Uncharacterized protein n=1 Tax=Entomophthora muscae TaxID=34485 RepID=A0ACC2RSZ0_9FUNG|nr:hypothetical protein DSO57_1026671 [Entomophthora muscae]
MDIKQRRRFNVVCLEDLKEMDPFLEYLCQSRQVYLYAKLRSNPITSQIEAKGAPQPKIILDAKPIPKSPVCQPAATKPPKQGFIRSISSIIKEKTNIKSKLSNALKYDKTTHA